MLITNNQITMSESEWKLFQELTWAPWRPRTPEEFNAMCELARARHMADNTGGVGIIHAIGVEAIKFGLDGKMNFPEDKRRTSYLKVFGTWPTQEELDEFETRECPVKKGLCLV